MRVAVISDADCITKRELRAAISAINIQVKEHFSPIWYPNAKAGTCLNLVPKSTTAKIARTFDAVMYIKDKPRKSDGTLGYHDRFRGTGMPYGYVYAEISEKLGESFSTTFSHEVLELLLNPWVCTYALGPDPDDPSRNVFHWYEACDAVQAQHYDIEIGSGELVSVSDFIRPLYFTPERERSPNSKKIAANNFMKSSKLRSFGVMPGGYIGYYDAIKNEDRNFFANLESERRYRIKRLMGSVRRTERLKAEVRKIAGSRHPKSA